MARFSLKVIRTDKGIPPSRLSFSGDFPWAVADSLGLDMSFLEGCIDFLAHVPFLKGLGSSS